MTPQRLASPRGTRPTPTLRCKLVRARLPISVASKLLPKMRAGRCQNVGFQGEGQFDFLCQR